MADGLCCVGFGSSLSCSLGHHHSNLIFFLSVGVLFALMFCKRFSSCWQTSRVGSLPGPPKLSFTVAHVYQIRPLSRGLRSMYTEYGGTSTRERTAGAGLAVRTAFPELEEEHAS